MFVGVITFDTTLHNQESSIYHHTALAGRDMLRSFGMAVKRGEVGWLPENVDSRQPHHRAPDTPQREAVRFAESTAYPATANTKTISSSERADHYGIIAKQHKPINDSFLVTNQKQNILTTEGFEPSLFRTSILNEAS